MSRPQNRIDAAPTVYDAPVHTAHPPAGKARLGPLQRLIGTLFSPVETFEDINRRPTWLAPLLIIIVNAAAFWLFFNSYAEAGWQEFMRETLNKQTAQSGGQPPNAGALAASVKLAKIFTMAAATVGGVIYYLVIAGVFAMAMMLMAAQTTFKKIWSVVLWAGAGTGLVQVIIWTASLLARDRDSLAEVNPQKLATLSATNPGAFLPSDTPPFLLTAASRIDIFSIWFLILLVIGFAAVSGMRKKSKGGIAAMVFGLWIVSILIFSALAAIFPR